MKAGYFNFSGSRYIIFSPLANLRSTSLGGTLSALAASIKRPNLLVSSSLFNLVAPVSAVRPMTKPLDSLAKSITLFGQNARSLI